MRRTVDWVMGTPFETAARRIYERVTGGSQNAVYDRLTLEIMRRTLGASSNCVDAGCHRGAMLRHMLRLAPRGRHHAFEPLPALYDDLVRRFPRSVDFHQIALSDHQGESSFAHVTTRPAYSGFRRRRYETGREEVEQITVQTDLLDNVVPDDAPVDFVKIDVEGAELEVLRGAAGTLSRTRPVIVFEHGIGAAEYYGSTTDAIYALLRDCGLDVSLLDGWLANAPPLGREAFAAQFLEGRNYYFVAHRRRAGA